MDQFLYHLAEMEYRMQRELLMWHELSRISHKEYLRIIKVQDKLMFLSEIIDLLPEEQATTFRKIEQKFLNML